MLRGVRERPYRFAVARVSGCPLHQAVTAAGQGKLRVQIVATRGDQAAVMFGGLLPVGGHLGGSGGVELDFGQENADHGQALCDPRRVGRVRTQAHGPGRSWRSSSGWSNASQHVRFLTRLTSSV